MKGYNVRGARKMRRLAKTINEVVSKDTKDCGVT